ncbi:MAG: hypothetical protein HFG20_07670 [Anaerotruncus sp.]|nr:hypothetical protein [Anaerotruncus sp.]
MKVRQTPEEYSSDRKWGKTGPSMYAQEEKSGGKFGRNASAFHRDMEEEAFRASKQDFTARKGRNGYASASSRFGQAQKIPPKEVLFNLIPLYLMIASLLLLVYWMEGMPGLPVSAPPALLQMKREYLGGRILQGILCMMPILVLVCFFVTMLLRRRRPDRFKTQKWRVIFCYGIALAVQLAGLFFVGYLQTELQPLGEDLNSYVAGKSAHYTGSLRWIARPKFITDPGYVYFEASDNDRLRCAQENITQPLLMQAQYQVEYLPNTSTIVTIKAMDGSLRTGKDVALPDVPKGYWLHGDLPVRQCTEVYGYDTFSPAAQKLFDLCYGEYFSAEVARQEKPTHLFVLPEPVRKDEYDRVLALYQASTDYDCYRTFRYDTNDNITNADKMIREVYAGGISYSIGEQNHYNQEFHQKAKQVVAQLPVTLSDYEKCLYLCTYLTQNVSYEQPAEQPERPRSDGITVKRSAAPVETGYGALVLGVANDKGYAQAFHLLAKEAGIQVLTVYGETSRGKDSHWNMVNLDGEWYHIDPCWVDDGYRMDGSFFLASDRQIGATHQAKSYSGSERFRLPQANGEQYNWFVQNGLDFQSAQQALDYLTKHPLARDQRLILRMQDTQALAELGRQLRSKGLLLYATQVFDQPPITGYIYRADTTLIY